MTRGAGERLRTADSAQRNDLKTNIYLGVTNSITNYSRVQLLQIYGNIHRRHIQFYLSKYSSQSTSFELLVVLVSS